MNEQQKNIFELLYPTFKFKKNHIKLFEAFAGIGSQAKALQTLSNELGFKLEVVGISEFDKYAQLSYEAVHGKVHNYGDITKIDKLPNDIDIFTYSFPCQDISHAGQGKGLKKGSGTRSGLLWEVERLLKASKKPKVLLMENVKALVSKKHKEDYYEWLTELEKLGYSNYWEILNSKHFGIPQNRERVFCVSILGEYNYDFPKGFDLKLKLKDLLEGDVNSKYYLSDKMMDYIVSDNEKWTGNNGNSLVNKSVASAINTGEGSRRCDASNYILNGYTQEERKSMQQNIHPTVKPTELMQYLVRLITPKGGTVLDPFMGSGSTGKACMIENVLNNKNYYFIGIDLEKEYCDIAKSRIEYGLNYIEEKEKEYVPKGQEKLF